MHTDTTGREGIGTVLRREREARGLSLDEIVTRTRIQRSQLEAIEREELHRLPPGPFVTGFVTSYARALGLRPEEILPLLPELDGRQSARVTPSLDMEVREIPVGGNRPAAPSGVWLTLAGLVLVVVLLGVAWQSPKVRALLLSRGSGSSEGTEQTGGPSSGTTSLLTGLGIGGPADAAGALPAKTGGPAAEVDKRATAADSSREAAEAEQGPGTAPAGTAAATPDATAASKQTATADTAASTAEASGTSEEDLPPTLRRLSPFVSELDKETYAVYSDSSVRPGQNQTVVVEAKARTYLKVSPSPTASPSYEGVLQVGEQKTFSTPGELWLVVGNAAGVSLTVNGAPLGKLGLYGERKGLAFRAQSE